jgi:Ca2+:H+ antiporter
VAPGAPTGTSAQAPSSSEETLEPEGEDSATAGEDDDGDISDAESFTLKDRQEAINVTHPFGIRIWKPALYKKDRSVQRNAEGDIHSSPGLFVSHWLLLFNICWTLVFGWWLALLTAAGGLLCVIFGFSQSCRDYSRVLFHLAGYLFYPFGKYVKLMQDEAYAEEDEGEGRSISEYEQWQSGDIEEGRLFFGPADNQGSIIGRRRNSVDSTDETTSLLGRDGRSNLAHTDAARTKGRLFGRGKWNFGRVIFFIFFYGIFTPALLLVSGLCWFMVFTIPMGKVTLLLFDHLRRHPLALSFHSDSGNARRPGESSSILLCTYRAVGLKYWKYTIDGTNIFLINLLGLVAFTIFDYWVLDVALGLKIQITDQYFVFTLALLSIIPLAYFIGQAVASISAQSSMGVGATINAFFSTIVEVFLYCVALKEGKAQLVEGSIIGSIFAGILFLPGLSMFFGAFKRKTQRFNVKSAGVTSTMLLFAIIAAFGPTLFYQIYGSVSMFFPFTATLC